MDQYDPLFTINDSAAVTLSLQSGVWKDYRKLYWKLSISLYYVQNPEANVLLFYE